MDDARTRIPDLADLVHRAATSDIRHDLDSLVDALTMVTVAELAEAFAAAGEQHPQDAVDLEALAERYETRGLAEAGHRRVVMALTNGIEPSGLPVALGKAS